VGQGHDVRYGDHLTEAEVEALLATHLVVSGSCHDDGLNGVMRLVEKMERS
jgi:hypothetical protein